MARTPYIRYVRHRNFNRLRNSKRTLAFLNEQAARLSMTPEQVWNDLMKAQGLTAAQVAALSAPDPDPDPEPGLPAANADWDDATGVFRFTAAENEMVPGTFVYGVNQAYPVEGRFGVAKGGEPAGINISVLSLEQGGDVVYNIMLRDATEDVNVVVNTYADRQASVVGLDGTVYFEGTLGSVGSPDNISGAAVPGAIVMVPGEYALVVELP